MCVESRDPRNPSVINNPSSTPSPRGGYITGLDPLRGLAAVSIALFHFSNNGWLPKGDVVTHIGFYFHFVIYTFFTISGFVIPYSMHLSGYRSGDFRAFFLKRMVRIYPPYIVCIAMMVSVELISFIAHQIPARVGVVDTLLHLFYLNGVLGRPWLLDIFWTLGIEVQFYLFVVMVWPLVISQKTAVFVAFTVVFVALSWWVRSTAYLFSCSAYLALGMVLFRQRIKLDHPAVVWSMVAALGFVIYPRAGLSGVIASYIVTPFLFLNVRMAFATFLGKVSYSFYLFHLPIGGTLLAILSPHVVSIGARYAWLLVAMLVSIGAAWVGHRFLELPAISWSKRVRYVRSGGSDKSA